MKVIWERKKIYPFIAFQGRENLEKTWIENAKHKTYGNTITRQRDNIFVHCISVFNVSLSIQHMIR